MKHIKQTISIILLLAAVMLLSSCARKDPYKWEGHSYQELRKLYNERFDEFQKVADIIAGNQEFWEKGREHPEAEGSAKIASPNDEKKMALFSEKDQAVLADFFNATKPYMISLRYNEYVEIDYINEDKTGGYSFVYFSSYVNGDPEELEREKQDIIRDRGNYRFDQEGNIIIDQEDYANYEELSDLWLMVWR
ncbi:MAG: hypothetical protein J5756_03645 [Clostridia bacterium]|nr:hypothetical protein [Clostridia bacterium]